MKKTYLSLLALSVLGAMTFTSCQDDPQPTPPGNEEVIDDYNDPEAFKRRLPGSINGDRTLSADTTYYLDGYVFVESGTLKVEPGTVIMGVATPTGINPGNESSLIVTRNAKIEAEGTAENPIIFTSESDAEALGGVPNLGPNDSKLWAGLIVLGQAKVDVQGANSVQIEGVIDETGRSEYGGTNDDHSSGILKYVSIRFTGAEIGPGDEIQGLTLGGVGRGTVIEDIDIFVSGDDGIEIFGGTVNLKRVSVAFAEDDSFDFDLGWSGSLQYAFAMQGGNDSDYLGEWDGASPDDNPLYTTARIYNATFIGRGMTANRDANSSAILIRDGGALSLYNSIIADFNGKGLEIEDRNESMDSYDKLINMGINKIAGNIWHTGNSTGIEDLLTITSGEGVTNADPQGTAIIAHLNDNDNVFVDPGFGGISRSNGSGELDPIPSATEAMSAVTPDTEDDIDEVNFKGAFDPAASTTWIHGWTTLAKFGYLK